MPEELEKKSLPESEEGGEDVEAHKNSINKSSVNADDEGDDVEAHKNSINKTSVS